MNLEKRGTRGKGEQPGKWTIDFPCHKRARALVLLVLLKRTEVGAIRAICYRFRTMVAKLTYAANDGVIFSTRVITRTVYMSLPPKMRVKIFFSS